MIGRAGRAGFGETGESILICKTIEAQKVSDTRNILQAVSLISVR